MAAALRQGVSIRRAILVGSAATVSTISLSLGSWMVLAVPAWSDPVFWPLTGLFWQVIAFHFGFALIVIAVVLLFRAHNCRLRSD